MVMIIDCSPVEKTYLDFARDKGDHKPLLACTYPEDDAAIAYLNAIMTKSKDIATVAMGPCDNEAQIIDCINTWNNQPEVSGILVISPPKDMENPTSHILDSKNVEGNDFDDRLERVSCTARSIVAIMAHVLAEGKPSKTEELFEGKNVVIVGYGKAVGKPLSYLLMRYHIGSVTTIHKYTSPHTVAFSLSAADIIVSATGNPHIFDGAGPGSSGHLRGKIIIDAGISRIDDKIVGDIPSSLVENNQVTPVPGGVGAVTTAMILANTTWAARNLLI
jgi:methylenetetrahydrofolate dehydrogenase (NADP+)/methenyltetrahydrofolate cyclohydrolase